MSETKMSFERLRAIWQTWGMNPGPAAKEQREALAAVETYLKSGPAAILRGMQALLIDPEWPGGSKRALFEPLWQATQEHWAAAGTEDRDVRYMQAMLLAVNWPDEDEQYEEDEEDDEQDEDDVASTLLSPWMAKRGRENSEQRNEMERWLARRTDCNDRGFDMLSELDDLSVQDYVTPQQQLKAEAFDRLRGPTLAALTSLHKTQEYLWWGQARYCHTLRKPFRRIGDPHRTVYLAAREAAQRAASLPVEPSAAYLQEVLHALDLPILEVRALAEHVKQLRNVLATDPPQTVPAELAHLLRQDAFGLPVSLLCAAPNTSDNALLEQLGVAADTPIDLGDWAAWIFRELVLLHRWPEQA